MNEALDSLYSPRNEHSAAARAAWLTMTKGYPLLVHTKLILSLEVRWTGHERPLQIQASNEKRFACISYRNRFSDRWKLTRSLSCIVLDEIALAILIEQTLRSDEHTMRDQLQDLELLTEENVTELIETLHNKSMIEHFVAATEKRSWALTQKDGRFVFIPTDDRAGVNAFVTSVKQASYARERPYLCFSTALYHKAIKGLPSMEAQSLLSRDHESHRRAPIEQVLNKDDTVLICHLAENSYLSEENNISLCLFQIGKDQEPPDSLSQLEFLNQVIQDNSVHHVTHVPSTIVDGNTGYWRIWRGGTSRDAFIPLNKQPEIRRKVLKWYRRLLQKYLIEREDIQSGSLLPVADIIHGLSFEGIDNHSFGPQADPHIS